MLIFCFFGILILVNDLKIRNNANDKDVIFNAKWRKVTRNSINNLTDINNRKNLIILLIISKSLF